MSAAQARLTEEDEFAMAEDEFAQMIDFLRSRQSRELSHAELEVALNERGRELLRVLFQSHVDSRGPGPAAAPVCGADGVERNQRRAIGVRLAYPTPRRDDADVTPSDIGVDADIQAAADSGRCGLSNSIMPTPVAHGLTAS